MSGTVESLDLRRDAAPGADRLVRELLKRGLPLDLLPAACRLAVELEEIAHERHEATTSSRETCPDRNLPRSDRRAAA